MSANKFYLTKQLMSAKNMAPLHACVLLSLQDPAAYAAKVLDHSNAVGSASGRGRAAALGNWDVATISREKAQGTRSCLREKKEYKNLVDYTDWYLNLAPKSQRLPNELECRQELRCHGRIFADTLALTCHARSASHVLLVLKTAVQLWFILVTCVMCLTLLACHLLTRSKLSWSLEQAVPSGSITSHGVRCPSEGWHHAEGSPPASGCRGADAWWPVLRGDQ